MVSQEPSSRGLGHLRRALGCRLLVPPWSWGARKRGRSEASGLSCWTPPSAPCGTGAGMPTRMSRKSLARQPRSLDPALMLVRALLIWVAACLAVLALFVLFDVARSVIRFLGRRRGR